MLRGWNPLKFVVLQSSSQIHFGARLVEQEQKGPTPKELRVRTHHHRRASRNCPIQQTAPGHFQ